MRYLRTFARFVACMGCAGFTENQKSHWNLSSPHKCFNPQNSAQANQPTTLWCTKYRQWDSRGTQVPIHPRHTGQTNQYHILLRSISLTGGRYVACGGGRYYSIEYQKQLKDGEETQSSLGREKSLSSDIPTSWYSRRRRGIISSTRLISIPSILDSLHG